MPLINTKTKMEVTNVETRVWEDMLARFELFADKVEALCESHTEQRLQRWLDNEQVCLLLQISKRTLHTYRSQGLLPYTQINAKMFYRPQDVEKVIEKFKQQAL